jgi:hypothetical protein
MSQEHLTTGSEVSEPKAPQRQELIEERTDTNYLVVLLEEAIAPIKSFASIIEDADPDVFNVLNPLVLRLNSDLMKLGEVIINTLGEIKILVCNRHMEIDGRQYYPGDFLEAVLGPKEARH